MDYRDYLLAAYQQEHPASSDEFLAAIKNIMGEGTLYDLHCRMCKKYGPPKLGTSRVAYLSKSVVFKVPVTDDGFRHNDWEGSLVSLGGVEGDPYFIPIARSRLHPRTDIIIVVMEKVEEVDLDEIKTRLGHLPDFVSAVDMGQVGFTRKGKLVAFDYADL